MCAGVCVPENRPGQQFEPASIQGCVAMLRQIFRLDTAKDRQKEAITGSGEEEEEEFYKLRPANKTDHLCQSWQYCHMFMKFRQSIT